MVKLTDRKIKWAINQVVKHKKSTKPVAQSLRVSQRRIQQLVKAYRDTGDYPTLNPNRRYSKALRGALFGIWYFEVTSLSMNWTIEIPSFFFGMNILAKPQPQA